MDDPGKASGAQKAKGQPRDARKKAAAGSRDNPPEGSRPAAERSGKAKAAKGKGKGKAETCSATDLLSELMASMPAMLPDPVVPTRLPTGACAGQKPSQQQRQQPAQRRPPSSRPAGAAGATPKELRWWIPQWDEQVIGRMAFASLGFHHCDLSRAPEPERLTDPRLKHALDDCAECRLTWLTGFNRLRGGGPGTQCTHPWHYACGRDNEDLMVDDGGGGAPPRKAPQRPPMSSIVVRIGAVAVAGGDDQKQDAAAAAFGVWFAEGSPYNVAEAMPPSSPPPAPETGDRTQQQQQADTDPACAAVAASKEAAEIAAATRALEVLEQKVLPACRARLSLVRQVPKDLSDLSQATDLVWARLQGVDQRLFANEVHQFEQVAREMDRVETNRFVAAPGAAPGDRMTIVGRVQADGRPGRDEGFADARQALADIAARLMPRLRDINRRLDDHHYVLMDECQRRTADAARQMGIADAGGRPPSGYKLRKWMDKRDAIVDDYLLQMQRTMGPDAHKMQTHYVRFIDNAESSWVEPWLRNSLGGLMQAPLPSPRDVLSGNAGGRAAAATAPKMEYNADSLLFNRKKPEPAPESPKAPAAAAAATPSSSLREAVLKHNAKYAAESASASAAASAASAAPASTSGGSDDKVQDRPVSMRVIIMSDSIELLNSVCTTQQGWRLATKAGRKARAGGGGMDPLLRDGGGRAGRNTAAWLRLWVAIARLRALADVGVVWYAVPRDQNGDAVRLARSAMKGKGKESK
ncbi:hypothetical protein RB597_001038 [Gaeumannomyces tritici]